jgi:hypothetical protein
MSHTYKFDIRIKLSHFDGIKKIFDSVNKSMEEFTGEKHKLDATSSLGTFSVTSEKELSYKDRITIANLAEKDFQEKTKNMDLTVEEVQDE